MSGIESLSLPDRELVTAAFDRLRSSFDETSRTVAAAGVTDGGEIITGMNIRHYAAMTCAEIAVLAQVQNIRHAKLAKIVGVRYIDGQEAIINSCGRCRQVLGDYYPDIEFVVTTGDDVQLMKSSQLLPFAYTTPSKEIRG